MCRFALIKSTTASDHSSLLESFAEMAKKSKAFDGDWQGDGWGYSYYDDSTEMWKPYHSLKPVWEDTKAFDSIPFCRIIAIHARSASFEKHKDVLEYNQPYVVNGMDSEQFSTAFVFNGLIKNVAIPIKLNGTIGAQKIHALIQKFYNPDSPQQSLEKSLKIIQKYTGEIQALNIGYSNGHDIFAYTQFSKHEEYYNIRVHQSSGLTIIASEPLGNLPFTPLNQQTVYRF